MIFYYLVLFFTSILNVAFSWMPTVTELPFGIDGFTLTAVGYLQAFVQIFWPIAPFYNFILFYIPFKLAIIVLKVFLGARTPYASV